MEILISSILKLVPIEIRQDKKHFIVEDQNSGEFYEMPQICIDAIRLINTGEQLGKIERQIKVKYPQEDVDLLDFTQQLLSLNLIEKIDGSKVERNETRKDKIGFLWISPHVGKVFFNNCTYVLYLLLFLANVILLFANPKLFPHYKDIFISNLMELNILIWIALDLVLVFIHEYGHILAMRANNLPTKLGIGHRLFLVVFETNMASAWRLPSKNRNVLYLAGMCFDTVILFLALISQVIFAGGPVLFLSIMRVVVLDTFIRMVYQCCIYMKTDLYFVFENVSGCYNLMENAQQLIRKRLPFLRPVSDAVVFEEEKRTIYFYSIFYFIGVALTIILFTVFYIPQLWFACKKVLPGFSAGLTSIHFWDAALFSVQILVPLFLLLYSWRKKYILHET